MMRDNVKGGALTEVTFYILLSLFVPRHGYAVMQFIEEKTGGRLALGAGTLYGALNALQKKGWIALYEDGGSGADKGTCGNGIRGENAGRKKEYIITSQGREAAERELDRLKELTETAEKIVGGVP